MSKKRILGLVRHVLTTLGGALVASGNLSQGELESIVGAVVIVIGAVWSWYDKREG